MATRLGGNTGYPKGKNKAGQANKNGQAKTPAPPTLPRYLMVAPQDVERQGGGHHL